MKKLLFAATALALTLTVACKKKSTDDGNGAGEALNVANTQNTFLVYKTATWCGPCGANGGPAFKGTLDNPNIIGVVMHISGSSALTPTYTPGGAKKDTAFVAPFAIQLYLKNKPTGSIPEFAANNVNLCDPDGNGSWDGLPSSTAVISAANTFKATAPTAGIAVKASASGNNIKIDYKTKSFTANSGEYYISLLLCEKVVTALQSGAPGGITDHKHIVRGTAFGTAASPINLYSPTAVLTNPTAGQEVSGSQNYTWELPALAARYSQFKRWDAFTPSNTMVAAVLWKKNGSEYEFVNAAQCDVK
jgi:hypothetical protein